ncbi:hypothetical protein GCM10009665_79850 [Kitasatospora nipponensis]|uniref:Uncharacterized protein n=1 Tax=Kitasatospora nipponensis TaxID=258049 RepID=A0ABP4DZL2_9ACTN
MAQSVRRTPPFTLNTDGHRHPRENTLVGIAAVPALLAFTTAFFHNLHLISSWSGLFGVLTALWGQFVSVTTAERFALMVSLVMAAVGFYLGVAHGGLYGGA